MLDVHNLLLLMPPAPGFPTIHFQKISTILTTHHYFLWKQSSSEQKWQISTICNVHNLVNTAAQAMTPYQDTT